MNKSFSKIRHIQESNSRLEKRLLGEQTEDLQDDKLQQIIDMDQALDEDPTYNKYEKVYTGIKLKRMLQDQMGMDLNDMSEEEVEGLIGMFSSMVDISKAGERPKMTRDTIINRKDSVMDIVNEILQMAIEDDEYELASKLRDNNKLLQDYN
jgi:protein-arginine kinase activator protein McsA